MLLVSSESAGAFRFGLLFLDFLTGTATTTGARVHRKNTDRQPTARVTQSREGASGRLLKIKYVVEI